MGRINVNSNPSGASFTFNGSNNVYTTPYSLRFSKSQTYKITFSKSGYVSKTISYRGGSGDINVKLERVQKKSDQNPGQEDMVRVNINSDPAGASFTMKGSNNAYKTPLSMRFSRSLTYSLTFSKPGYVSKTISYRGGSGDIFVSLDQAKQQKSNPKKNNKNPVNKQKPDNTKRVIKISSNPNGAAFVIAGNPSVNFTPASMTFTKNKTYHITFTMPGYLPKTIVYKGGSGNISVKLDKQPRLKH